MKAELIRRTLISDNDGNIVPSSEDLQKKIMELYRETIVGGIYKYANTLQESLYKVKYGLLGMSDYRFDQATHEADKIYQSYYHCQDTLELQRNGMGKETLSLLLKWLRGEKRLKISKKRIIASISDDDVPVQLNEILSSLRSNVVSFINDDNIDPTRLPVKNIDLDPQEQLSFDEIIQMELS